MGAGFLIADLILKARFDLRPLVALLANSGLIVLGEVGVKGGIWTATLESHLMRPTPERTADRILTANEKLEEAEQLAWRGCIKRCLDFGYDACDDKFESTSPKRVRG